MEFVTTLYHGKFLKEEKKGKGQSIYIYCDPTLRAIDLDHASQLLAKTDIIVLIPKRLQQCEQGLNLLLSTTPKRERLNLV